MRIDAHIHHALPASKWNEFLREPHESKLWEGDCELVMNIASKTVEEMDKHHISIGLISGVTVFVDNYVTAYPGRFLPIFFPEHPTRSMSQEVELFEEAIKGKGYCGLGEMLNPYVGMALNDERMFPLYEKAQKLKVPVFFHTGSSCANVQKNLAPAFRIRLSDPILLEDIAIAFPELKVVMCHMGWPFLDHMEYMLYCYENFYCDLGILTLTVRDRFPDLLRRLPSNLRRNRVLWGSDLMGSPGELFSLQVKGLEECDFLTEEEKFNIFGRNAARLLGLVAFPPQNAGKK